MSPEIRVGDTLQLMALKGNESAYFYWNLRPLIGAKCEAISTPDVNNLVYVRWDNCTWTVPVALVSRVVPNEEGG